jgi:hypothetical protein
MAKHARSPSAAAFHSLEPARTCCPVCEGALWVAYPKRRTVVTLRGVVVLQLTIRRCVTRGCPAYYRPYHPEEEGAWALPHQEIGLDVIAQIGALRYGEHRSVPEIHQALRSHGVPVCERSVTNLLQRYEELVALQLRDQSALQERLRAQGRVLLALDGLQPDVGHEVLWVLRDVLSGEILLARSLLSATEPDLVGLFQEVQAGLPVPIRGVVSDSQESIQRAVRTALPGVPHQLCQFHYLRQAALPIYEADRHAKKELKKRVRGIRPIERAMEARQSAGPDPAAAVIQGYCLAVRSALTDDGQPPLEAAGLRLHDRLAAIEASLARVEEKGGFPRN